MVLLLIIVIVCLAWLLYPQIKQRFEKPVPQGAENYRPISRKEADIMGKSRFSLRQSTPNEASESQVTKRLDKETIFAAEAEKSKGVVVPEEALEGVFSNASNAQNEPLDIDIEAEYDTDEKNGWDEEELEQALGHEVNYADGVTFEDIEDTMKVLSNDNSGSEEQDQAGEVLCRIQSSDMFGQIISGSVANRAKVKSLLAFHMAKFNKSNNESGVPESGKHDLTGFLS
jgi:hypothetical protein